MKFVIERASRIFSDNPPCEEAYRDESVSKFDKDFPTWCVDVDDVMVLFKKYGDIVIRNSEYSYTIPVIIIYDDYIE